MQQLQRAVRLHAAAAACCEAAAACCEAAAASCEATCSSYSVLLDRVI